MDTLFFLEMGLVALVILLQFLVYFRNSSAIRQLAGIFPDAKLLRLQTAEVIENEAPAETPRPAIRQIEDNPRFSPEFRDILRSTNAYLARNKGEADFDILRELAKDKAASQEKAISANISLPLYIGLMCTFGGVIVGLIKIALTGVSDAAIQAFIGGVLIGMLGSAAGLALTVRSNYRFKDAKKQRDRHLYDYFTFLRLNILPPLKKESQEPVSSLRLNLAAFNEGFAQYQRYMNESLSETLRLLNELKDASKQLRGIEEGIKGIGHFLRSNDGLIEKQVEYLDTYAQKAEALTQKLTRHFAYADLQLETLVAENLKALDQRTQVAYATVDHLLAHNGEAHNGNGHAFAGDIGGMHGQLQDLQSQQLEVNAQLLEKLRGDQQQQQELKAAIEQMTAQIAQSQIQQQQSFVNSKGFRLFVYVAVAASATALLCGGMYLFNVLL